MNCTKVLVIEDDPQEANLIQRFLMRKANDRFEIFTANRLATGIELLARGVKHDIVLLDLNLPDSRGLATLQNLLNASSSVPIIVLTGYEDESIALQALRMGADDYVMKSDIIAGILPRTIRYAIERRAAHDNFRSQQLAMLNQITGAAMHEFNNLILIVGGNIDLLHDEIGEPDLLDRIGRVKAALFRMASLTTDLAAFTRKQSDTPLPLVSLDTALMNIQRMLTRTSVLSEYRQ
jgi:phosphoserine phosphatase RsbU/P